MRKLEMLGIPALAFVVTSGLAMATNALHFVQAPVSAPAPAVIAPLPPAAVEKLRGALPHPVKTVVVHPHHAAVPLPPSRPHVKPHPKRNVLHRRPQWSPAGWHNDAAGPPPPQCLIGRVFPQGCQ